ncbi:MAG: 16S rRNA processing protein RimM [Anaerolineaceae bacterium]|nr:16S rRNA processing protein RimM [Anaerolineaceae bacterium]
MTEPRYLMLGEILRPHGVRGELRMRILTDYPERIPQLDHVFVAESIDAAAPKTYKIEHMRMHKEYGLLKLKGINSREQADLLRQLVVMVAIEDAIPLEEGEFYLYQLIGLTVRTVEGTALGTITDILETGANDVYIVDSDIYGELLIPVTEETILETSIEQGTVVVSLPDGLLPE